MRILPVVVVSVLMAACSGDDSSPRDGANPDASLSEAAAPEAAAPEAAAPEAAVPEAAQPEAAVPEAAVPEAALPDVASDTANDVSEDATQDTTPDSAEEAQAPDSGDLTCGGIGFIGACDGDEVLWCLSGEIYPYDCTNPALDYAGPDRTCGLQDCTSEADGCKGYFCVVKEGLPCDPLDPVKPALCDAESHGCLNGVCAPSPACDSQSYVRHCEGDVLTYCKYRVQNVDCTLGGTESFTCGENSVGQITCLGLEGGGCDLAKGYECVAGLVCTNHVCTQS